MAGTPANADNINASAGVMSWDGVATINTSAITQYDILVGGASNAIVSVTPNTSGYVLTSNGTSANPSFQVPASASGALIELAKRTASNSAAISFTSIVSSSYSTYFLNYSNVVPATADTTLNLQISTNNGSSWIASSYEGGCLVLNWSTGGQFYSSSTSSAVLTNIIGNSQNGLAGNTWLYNLQNSQGFLCRGTAVYVASTPQATMDDHFGWNTNTSVNAIRLVMNAGNITSGTFTLYGLVEA